MASVLNQIPNSSLSLQGNGYNPQPNSPDWGYIDASANVNPAVSKLQNTYSIDNNPVVRLKDFNRTGTALIRPGASLDELDPNAPRNTQAGLPGSVVSQIYKSATGRKYKDLGPQPGRY
jgi:hypothetical protein